MSKSEDKELKISTTPTPREEIFKKSSQADKVFITDGEHRVLSRSEKDDFWEEFDRRQEQKEYDKLLGRKPSTEKNSKSLIPESTEIPNFKPSNFDDWEITIDMENRKFNFYNTRRKANVNIKFDQLGFRVSRKGENVKINTLYAYALLKEYEHEGAGNIVHHARIEREIKSIAVYRRTLQRVFREYLTIRSDSKLFEKIYHDEKDGKQTIVYKCNAELKTAENEYVYNTELIDNATTVEHSDAPRRTRKSTSSDY
jgi:hypothetical protein